MRAEIKTLEQGVQPDDVLKDPYVLEFLNLKDHAKFTFWFGIMSVIIIILLTYYVKDEKNVLLLGFNPILDSIAYIEPFRTWIWNSGVHLNLNTNNEVTIQLYIAHFITFILYGIMLDLSVYGIKRLLHFAVCKRKI